MPVLQIDLSANRRSRQAKEKLKEKHSVEAVSVIAIDPGGTTGWSLMVLPPEALSDPSEKILTNIEIHQHGEVSTYLGRNGVDGEAICVDDIWAMLKCWPDSAIVIEDFILRQLRKDSDLLSPVRVTAALSYLIWKDRRVWHKQSPADAKNVATDDRLRRWGLYSSDGGLQHARDADRHAILFLRKAKEDARIRAEVWPWLYGKDAPYA